MAAEERSGACRANTQVANYTLTSMRVLVPPKRLISGAQRIPGHHRDVFLWAANTSWCQSKPTQIEKALSSVPKEMMHILERRLRIRCPRIPEAPTSQQNESLKSQKPKKAAEQIGLGGGGIAVVPQGDVALALPRPMTPFVMNTLWLYASAGVAHQWALTPKARLVGLPAAEYPRLRFLRVSREAEVR